MRFVQFQLAFDQRREAERLVPLILDDPDGAAYALIALRDLLASNGIERALVEGDGEDS